MKRMALTPKWDDFKHRRHVLRLALNVRTMRERSRFNPTLPSKQILVLNSLAKNPMENVYKDALAIARS